MTIKQGKDHEYITKDDKVDHKIVMDAHKRAMLSHVSSFIQRIMNDEIDFIVLIGQSTKLGDGNPYAWGGGAKVDKIVGTVEVMKHHIISQSFELVKSYIEDTPVEEVEGMGDQPQKLAGDRHMSGAIGADSQQAYEDLVMNRARFEKYSEIVLQWYDLQVQDAEKMLANNPHGDIPL